jgi:hypothetical protein
MKTTLNSLLTIAAGFALSAAGAYGQELNANIPFSFHTASGVQPAGEYRVSKVTSDGAVMRLQNYETGHSAMTSMGKPSTDAAAKPQLVFKCGSESGCALSAVKLGDGREWQYKAPKMKTSEQERIAVVYLRPNSAE